MQPHGFSLILLDTLSRHTTYHPYPNNVAMIFFRRIILLIFSSCCQLAYSQATTKPATAFWPILQAHVEPNNCPKAADGTWSADVHNYVCCFTSVDGLTTQKATIVVTTNVYACCLDGYDCTGDTPSILGWATDISGSYWFRSLRISAES